MISILLPDFRGGGAERVMLDLAREFARLGYSVEFVLMQAKGEFLSEAEHDFSVVDLAVTRVRKVPAALARYLRNRTPSEVIANMWPLTSAAVIGRALSHHHCRLMLVEQNTLTPQYASWGRLHALMMSASMISTYRFADVVTAVSQGAAFDTAQLARMSDDRVKVLNNPIRKKPMPSHKAKINAEELWGCPPGQRILTVGSLKDQKNHPLLLRAFAELSEPRSKLMLLGQGGNEAMLRALSVELGIADRVIFAGFHSDPSPFYATTDLFVLTSDHEGLPTVLIEALSFGCSVVSTDCPSGPAEILMNGRFGRLVPMGDEGALARAMEAALDTTVDRDALIRRAADYTPEIAARKYLDLLGLS